MVWESMSNHHSATIKFKICKQLNIVVGDVAITKVSSGIKFYSKDT